MLLGLKRLRDCWGAEDWEGRSSGACLFVAMSVRCVVFSEKMSEAGELRSQLEVAIILGKVLH
jgi:hypothetical protein